MTSDAGNLVAVTAQGEAVFVFLVPQGRGIPDAYRPIVSAGKEPLAIGTVNDTANGIKVAAQSQSFVTQGHIPDLHGLINASRCQAPAVGTERQAADAARVRVQIVKHPAGSRIPNLQLARHTTSDDSTRR